MTPCCLLSCSAFNLSIKYSTELTKDNVFSGLRFIVQGLGEAMNSGRRVVVEFEHGVLTCEEKRCRFSFRGELYAKEGVPVPKDATTGASAYRLTIKKIELSTIRLLDESYFCPQFQS